MDVLIEPEANDTAGGLDTSDLNAFASPSCFAICSLY